MNYLIFILLASLCSIEQMGHNEKSTLSTKTLPLKYDWTLRSSADSETEYQVSVPTTVMGALTSNGLYGNIFKGDAYATADRSPFDTSWIYSKSFGLDIRDGYHTFLDFDGISYRADIWLNGTKIASKDTTFGPFRRFSFDVSGIADTDNDLKVEIWKARRGEPNIGFVDWNPRPLDDDMGLFRGVEVRFCGNVMMQNTGVTSRVDTSSLNEARLCITTDLRNLTDKEIKGRLKGRIEDAGIEFSLPVTLAANSNLHLNITPQDVKALDIKNPRLWWSWDLGNPELYRLELEFETGGKVSDSEKVTFGIRQIDSYLTSDGYRGFILNGKKILVKGAGWTDDIFLRDTPESNELQIQYVKDMNLNAIRCEGFWGNDASLYDLCDRYGILVLAGWSCQWEWKEYLGTPDHDDYGCITDAPGMNLLAASFRDQVNWLRNHPSIITWFTGSDRRPAPELDAKYKELLKGCGDDRPVICSAKGLSSNLFGPAGMKMEGPYEYEGPNYWYTDTLCGGAFGFNTETSPGPQLPVKESIEKFIPAESLWPVGNMAYDFHCTQSASGMNSLSLLTGMINAKYGRADSLEDYLRKAYLLSYESTKSMYEAFRINKGKATGIIQWMLNSAWPKLYWQLYDYYGVPTSAYYGVKDANNRIQLIYNYKDGGIYVVDDSYDYPETLKAVVKCCGPDGRWFIRKEKPITVKQFSSVKIDSISLDAENSFLFLELYRGIQKVSGNFYALSSHPDIYDYKTGNWFHTPVSAHSDFKALSSMPKALLKVSVKPSANSAFDVTLSNESEVPAFFIELKLVDRNGDIVVPAFWSRNYVSIAPESEEVLNLRLGRKCLEAAGAKICIDAWNVPDFEVKLK